MKNGLQNLAFLWRLSFLIICTWSWGSILLVLPVRTNVSTSWNRAFTGSWLVEKNCFPPPPFHLLRCRTGNVRDFLEEEVEPGAKMRDFHAHIHDHDGSAKMKKKWRVMVPKKTDEEMKIIRPPNSFVESNRIANDGIGHGLGPWYCSYTVDASDDSVIDFFEFIHSRTAPH